MTDAYASVIVAMVAVIVILLVAWFGGKLLVAFLRRLARHTRSSFDGGLIEAVGGQISWLIAAAGFGLAAVLLPSLGESARWLFENTSFLLIVAAFGVGLSRLFDYSLDRYVDRGGDDIDMNMANQLVPLAKRLVSLVITVAAVLIIAAHLGIDVLAVTAALGLTGFAIALAAKDTISNIISGLVIMISRPFAIGERIDVPSLGVWGDVVDIGIRSSTVVTRDNRTVIVPNSAVVDNPVTNYSRPDTSYRLEVDIGLGTDVDMRLAQEAIRAEVRAVENVLPDRPVDIWFTGFGDYYNSVRVRWWVDSFARKRASTDAVCAAIADVAAREGISMPDPHSTVDGSIELERVTSLDGAP